MNERTFKISMSLNVLNHLGINLYSNIPAVMSEVVANSWDADAENVYINVNREEGTITIDDDGIGMDYNEINEKYLNVGYPRREHNESLSLIHNRPVMGRKGIGKLSLFSIAEIIEVHTMKNGESNALCINVEEMRESIKSEAETYNPASISPVDKQCNGMKIKLTELKKRIHRTETFLKKRLARRFSIIGDQYLFNIYVNDEKVTLEDRDYFHKIQYIWTYGSEAERYIPLCTNLENSETRPNYISTEEENDYYYVSGWIGTVKSSGDLQDGRENLNKIVIMVRGKVAQEDILEDFSEGGIYSKYIFGEINADFLDKDDLVDITTTSRQRIIEDDPRYAQLKAFIYNELKNIQSKWTELRNTEGTSVALQLGAIKEWFDSLENRELRKRAKQLFGKINQLPIEPEQDKFMLMKHGILAFENLRYKDQLDSLENIDPEDIHQLTKIFSEFDEIEASLYYQIASERMRVINTLNEKLAEHAKEKVIQEYIFDHLWLLDPSWERATGHSYMEEQVRKRFEDINSSLTQEERDGRIDIRYVTAHGKHLIVELKRSNVTVSTFQLASQISKYRNALLKCLEQIDEPNKHIECICIVGKELSDWKQASDSKEVSEGILDQMNAYVMFYDSLLANAYHQYKDYLEANRKAGRINEFITKIEEEINSLSEETSETSS